MKITTKTLARTGIISALYVVLSLVTFPVASGAIQFRVSEGLCLLPLIFPESCISLFFGCFITNLITGCAAYDCIFGSIISLLSGVLTALTGKFIKNTPVKIFVGGLFPVILNAFLLPVIWYFCYGELETVYILQVCFLLISQTVSVYLIGTGLAVYFIKRKNRLTNGSYKQDRKDNTEEKGEENEK